MRHFLGLAGPIGILTGCMSPGAPGRTLVLGPGAPNGFAAGLLGASVEAVPISAVAVGADPHQLTTSSA